MGWFLKLPWKNIILSDFRPRLGMGWFKEEKIKRDKLYRIFVPDWGWVGSAKRPTTSNGGMVFVPEWGWVGSVITLTSEGLFFIFVPAWGWVGSQSVSFYSGKDEIFVPEWGWVGSRAFLPM